MIIKTSRQFTNLTMVRLPSAFALSVSLAWLGLPGKSVRAATAADLNLKSQAQLRSEAALYDTAIREISRISSMRLSNPDESKAALVIFKKQTPNLKFSRSKLITIGLNDGGFAAAINAKAGNDKKSQQQFAVQLAQNPKSILQVSGAESLKANMIRSAEADAALLRKVSEQFRQAADAIKASVKRHHTAAWPAAAVTATNPVPSPLPDIGTDTVVSIGLIVDASILCPPLGFALLDIAANIFAAEVVVGAPLAVVHAAEDLLLELKKAASNDNQQKTAIQDCEDKANTADANCEAAAASLFPPLDTAAQDACAAALLFNLAACLLI